MSPVSHAYIPILVMEKMDESLRSSLERYPKMPMTIKLSILLDVSLGLRYLHSHKIVHRDFGCHQTTLIFTEMLCLRLKSVGFRNSQGSEGSVRNLSLKFLELLVLCLLRLNSMCPMFMTHLLMCYLQWSSASYGYPFMANTEAV